MNRIVVSPADTDTVVAAIATVDPTLFAQYQGTWRDSISMALLGAVYSIQAAYHASEGKGVWNRLQTFHEAHGDAAERLCGLGVETADGLRARLPDAGRWTESEEFLGAHNVALRPLKKACTGVHGLGAVTFEYFLILVGVPGVKADAMIRQMSQDKLFGKPIVTEVKALDNYWPAEEYHQDFFEKNPYQGYCVAVAGPKVAKFRKTFAELSKD